MLWGDGGGKWRGYRGVDDTQSSATQNTLPGLLRGFTPCRTDQGALGTFHAPPALYERTLNNNEPQRRSIMRKTAFTD